MKLLIQVDIFFTAFLLTPSSMNKFMDHFFSQVHVSYQFNHPFRRKKCDPPLLWRPRVFKVKRNIMVSGEWRGQGRDTQKRIRITKSEVIIDVASKLGAKRREVKRNTAKIVRWKINFCVTRKQKKN